MKKLALAALAATALPALAFAQGATTTTTAPAAAAAAPAAGMPATAPAMTASTKLELQDGSWAELAADGSVKVSKDGGKTWAAPADGTLVAKDGKTTITTKGGRKMM